MIQAVASHELLSVTEAAKRLKDRGVRHASRHGVYVALASGRLALAGTAHRVMLIRREDVERYADELAAASTDSPS